MTPAGLPHSEILGSQVGYHLPEAYRRFLRPSSAPDAKASTVCPYQLGHKDKDARVHYAVLKKREVPCSTSAPTNPPPARPELPGTRAGVHVGGGSTDHRVPGVRDRSHSLRTQQRAKRPDPVDVVPSPTASCREVLDTREPDRQLIDVSTHEPPLGDERPERALDNPHRSDGCQDAP